jgi:hypothetical protein
MLNAGGEFTKSGSKRNDAATSANYSKMSEAVVEGIPIATFIPNFVKVSVPSDLPEGYQFTVLANNVRLIVAVVSTFEAKFLWLVSLLVVLTILSWIL